MKHDSHCELNDPNRLPWQGKSCECGSRAYPLCVGCRNGRHMQHQDTNTNTGKLCACDLCTAEEGNAA